MNCKCNIVELILTISILVFLWWPNPSGNSFPKIAITTAALILIIHTIFCKQNNCSTELKLKPKLNKKKK